MNSGAMQLIQQSGIGIGVEESRIFIHEDFSNPSLAVILSEYKARHGINEATYHLRWSLVFEDKKIDAHLLKGSTEIHVFTNAFCVYYFYAR